MGYLLAINDLQELLAQEKTLDEIHQIAEFKETKIRKGLLTI
ncbi:hypothetical protein [Candidatus Lokiarchaeum ossiferum]